MNARWNDYRYRWNNYTRIGLGKVPIHLDIELTTKCNYRCSYCEQSFNPPKPQDMDFDLYKKIIDEFSQKNGCSVKLVYVGEPLLYPKLIEAVKYAKDKGLIDIIISTNASLLTEKIAIGLIENGVTSLTFSVDSCKKEVYESVRRGGKFETVVHNIRNFSFCKEVLQSETPITRIQTIRQPLTNEEIDSGEYKDFWSPYVDEIRIHPLVEDYTDSVDFGEQLDFMCPSPFRRMTIRVDGRVAVCCGTRSDEKIIGEFPKQSLEEIWTCERFNRIRMLMRKRQSHLIDICKRCSSRKPLE